MFLVYSLGITATETRKGYGTIGARIAKPAPIVLFTSNARPRSVIGQNRHLCEEIGIVYREKPEQILHVLIYQ